MSDHSSLSSSAQCWWTKEWSTPNGQDLYIYECSINSHTHEETSLLINVLLVNGAGCDARTWAPVVKHLNDPALGRIVAYDMNVGHGGCILRSIDDLSTECARVVKETNLVPSKSQNLILVGHSVGGALINRLDLPNTALVIIDVHENLSTKSALQEYPGQEKTVTDWFKGFSEKFLNDNQNVMLKVLMVSEGVELDKQLLIAQMQGKYQFEPCPGSGHMLPTEDPERVAGVINRLAHRMGTLQRALASKLDTE